MKKYLILLSILLLGTPSGIFSENNGSDQKYGINENRPTIVKPVEWLEVEDYKYDHGNSVILKLRLSESHTFGVDHSYDENNPVRLYRILMKYGPVDENEEFKPEEFSEIMNITPYSMSMNLYEQSVKDDRSTKDKFRMPFLKEDENVYYVRIKSLREHFERTHNWYIRYYKYMADEIKLDPELPREKKREQIKEFRNSVLDQRRQLRELKKELKKDWKVSFIVVVESQDGVKTFGDVYQTISPQIQHVNFDKWLLFIVSLSFILLMLYTMHLTRKGKEFFIRPIAGLSAVEEAVGRATEMGRPVLYIAGLSGISDIATLASINILGQIAKKVAIYETPLIVPCYDPIVYTVIREVVREAYVDVGKPEAFQEENVFYLTSAQFAYAAGVNGIMVREKPATVFYMGMFFAESLLMSETGNQIGAIQVAGTDAITQLPFFITTCDYTLIGEELYAASAYLSKDPLLLSTLKVQDIGKSLIMIAMFAGYILLIFGVYIIPYLLQNIPD